MMTCLPALVELYDSDSDTDTASVLSVRTVRTYHSDGNDFPPMCYSSSDSDSDDDDPSFRSSSIVRSFSYVVASDGLDPAPPVDAAPMYEFDDDVVVPWGSG